MIGTMPKGYESKNKEKKYVDHSERNTWIIGLSIAFAVVFAFGYFSGMFAWMHDMVLDTEKNKANIKASIEAETSCRNLTNFIQPWQDHWDLPYAVQMAKQRMVELKC